jgi:hypothetical protein
VKVPADQRKKKPKNDKYNGLFGDVSSSDDDNSYSEDSEKEV